jgi:flagellar hook-basal body complex protein FliE
MTGVIGLQSLRLESAAASAVKPSAGAATGTADFGAVLQEVASSAIQSLKAGEAAAIQGIEGKMPVQKVVEAVMEAEKSFQTAIAVRDKVVSAYLEISRMQI